MRQKAGLFFLFLTSFFFIGSMPPEVSAQVVSNLPATPIAQRFSPPDPNGNDGSRDCMAAALTGALQILADTGNLNTTSDEITYANVRGLLRSWAPDLRSGITPEVLSAATPVITKQDYALLVEEVSEASWDQYLRQELSNSRPVIVHMADRNALFNPASTGALSHVIVVFGIDEETVSFTDSWDGMIHSIPHERFSSAWSRGHYRWLAFRFIPQG